MNRMNPEAEAQSRASDQSEWWRGAVVYQIYVRSFQDSNGDGIGDIAGIIHRLQHVADLGVDAIWITPFYPSPQLDYGYDVSDYCGVDAMFGALGDFDALVRRAHELGLKIMIDLVLSHSSDQHPWFHESRSGREGNRADWYVWADPKPDGNPPNNWLSIFGGPAWEWDTERLQYYLHNFLPQQPDLNFHNPDVQQALLGVVRFWLDRGVDGFRLDTVNFYFHDPALTDNPAMEADERNYSLAPAINPYNFQLHIHDKNRPEVVGFLRRFRALLDKYPGSASIGEVGEGHRSIELQAEYTSGGDKLHMAYSFTLLAQQRPDGARFAEVIRQFGALAAESWAAWAFSNHDVARFRSRWGLDERGCRVYAALLLSLRGSICLYQGEELGLPEAYVPFEQLKDPYGIRFWPRFRGRDGARTPIPWTADTPNGGFSQGAPWLPVAMEHLDVSVHEQNADPGSMLNLYRAMLAFRRSNPALIRGRIEVVRGDTDVVAFIRSHAGTRMFCAFNLTGSGQPIELPEGAWQEAEAPFTTTRTEGGVHLPPWQAFFARTGA